MLIEDHSSVHNKFNYVRFDRTLSAAGSSLIAFLLIHARKYFLKQYFRLHKFSREVETFLLFTENNNLKTRGGKKSKVTKKFVEVRSNNARKCKISGDTRNGKCHKCDEIRSLMQITERKSMFIVWIGEGENDGK
jgi:hypothetical protein